MMITIINDDDNTLLVILCCLGDGGEKYVDLDKVW